MTNILSNGATAEQLERVERLLFERYATTPATDVPLLFILGSPRTGSTLIYQMMINAFHSCYFSNIAADNFANYPSIGMVLQNAIAPSSGVAYESSYGKTKLPWEPSEASMIFKNWFGGEQPSQTKSSTVLPEKLPHMQASMQAVYGYTQRVLVTKNAWNCFRIQALASAFPNAHFLWIRRDIAKTAISDLEARYRRGDPTTTWNSATTANYRDIQKRPYWEQVVEQQYEYNRIMATDLQAFAPGRYLDVWYENLCATIAHECERLEQFFKGRQVPLTMKDVDLSQFEERTKASTLQDDYAKIVAYIATQRDRLQGYGYPPLA